VARRTKRVTIKSAGRDIGKTFELREMPADQAERWANRCLLAFANAGGKLPDNVLESDGMAGLALTWRNALVVGLLAFKNLAWRDVEPLLEEMMPCMQWCPPGNAPLQPIFPGEDSQIEEVATRYELRYELIQLHLGFSLADVDSTTGTNDPGTPSAS
jgi:hypothetical protein